MLYGGAWVDNPGGGATAASVLREGMDPVLAFSDMFAVATSHSKVLDDIFAACFCGRADVEWAKSSGSLWSLCWNSRPWLASFIKGGFPLELDHPPRDLGQDDAQPVPRLPPQKIHYEGVVINVQNADRPIEEHYREPSWNAPTSRVYGFQLLQIRCMSRLEKQISNCPLR